MTGESLRQKHVDRTRQAIADAARALFRERGFHATTIDDIAERADVAPRTFFRYFPTKESVLFVRNEEKLKTLRERILARPPEEPAVESLVAVMRELANEMWADSEWSSLVCQLVSEDPLLLQIHRRGMIEETSTALARALAEREGMQEPDLRLQAVTAAMVACMATALGAWLDAGASEDPSPYIDEALRAARAAFA